MNVFESIKGSFKNVQQDLYDGLKALTSLDSQPRHGMLRRLHTDGVNLDAGADILNKYQNTWKELQGTTVENAEQAENVDCQIGLLFVKWDRQWESMGHLESEVKEIPNVLSMICEISNTLGYVEERCRQVEEALERLEDVCEQQQMQHDQKSHIEQLAIYKRKRRDEVEKIKVELAKTHAKTMQSYDRQRMRRQKEREEAFSEAFSEDINFYQTHGHLERLNIASITIPKVSSLSDITLEQDSKVLDEFLDSAEVEDSKDIPDTKKHSTSISEPDGTFFEDDYTTDYNLPAHGNIQQDDYTTDYNLPASGNIQQDDNTTDYNLPASGNIQQDDNHSQYRTETEHSGPKCDETEQNVLVDGENISRPISDDNSSKLPDESNETDSVEKSADTS